MNSHSPVNTNTHPFTNNTTMKNISIIGSGNIGGNLGLHLAKAGYPVFFSSRHPEALKELTAQAAKAKAGTLEEAACFGEVIVLAIPFGKIPEVSREIGTLAGKILVDATNPYPSRDGQVASDVLADKNLTATEFTAQHFSGAKVVKAINTVYFKLLKEKAFRPEGERMAIPYAGNDQEAKEVFRQLLDDIGFQGVDIGDLSMGRYMEPDQTLYNKELTEAEIRERIKQ